MVFVEVRRKVSEKKVIDAYTCIEKDKRYHVIISTQRK